MSKLLIAEIRLAGLQAALEAPERREQLQKSLELYDSDDPLEAMIALNQRLPLPDRYYWRLDQLSDHEVELSITRGAVTSKALFRDRTIGSTVLFMPATGF